VGSHHQGKVVRLQPFGAFVELAPGIDGLVHVSNLADRRINHPKEVVDVDQQVEVVVEKVEPTQKRVALALWREGYTGPREVAVETPGATAPASNRPKIGDVQEVTVDRIEPFGIFVTFAGGRGLIPNVELGTPKGADHRKLFPGGSKIKAAIIEIDGQSRLKLSKVAAEHAEERAEVQHYLKTNQPRIQGKGFGTLGDLLKAKLK
jgi:small subunit ribosomal protein S1